MTDFLGMAFVPYYNHIIKLLETNDELKRTAKGIFKQMAWAAGGACAGGVVAGPPGALVGTIAGAVIGYCQSDQYKAMIVVLKGLSDEDKEKLVKEVQQLVGVNGLEALTRFIGNQVQREMLLSLIQNFVKDVQGG